MPLTALESLTSILSGRKAALLIVDLQVDFIAPGGFCARQGADLSHVPSLLVQVQAAIAAARAAGLTIVFIRLETSPHADSQAMLDHLARLGRPDGAALCRAGTHGARLWGVAPEPRDLEIVKTRYDAFLETALDARLRRRGIEVVIVAGVSTDCCVDSTARAAFMRDYDVVVLADACGAGADHDHDAALGALGRYAATIAQTADFAAALKHTALQPEEAS